MNEASVTNYTYPGEAWKIGKWSFSYVEHF